MNLQQQFIIALIATILIEFFILLILTREKPLHVFFFSILINLLTVPVAWYLQLYLINNFIITEVIVFLSESILIMVLFEVKYLKATIFSFTANFITASMSFLFLYLEIFY
jgi:hypothetical protein